MSKRQTTGNISPSQLRNLTSNVSALRVGKEATISKGRKSMAVTSMSEKPLGLGLLDRRSSAFSTKSSGPKQDPRPLNDKNFLNGCVKTVLGYLTTHNYPVPVTPKTLQSPTGKDFAMMVQFLFLQIDPSFKISGKIEDEVPVFFKRLNYPFPISKSALFAVGSPHTWPAVLASLAWLVELLNYMDRTAREGIFSGAFDRDKEGKATEEFLNYVMIGYSSFMQGNDLHCKALDDDLERKFREKTSVVEDRCERVKKANAQILEEISRLRSLPDPVDQAVHRRQEEASDKEKFERLITGLQSSQKHLQQKLQEKQFDLQARRQQLEAAAATAEQLRARVASQALSREDVQRLLLDRDKQREVLDTERRRVSDLERRVYDQNVQIALSLTDLENRCQVHNAWASRLKLAPASAKRAEGVNYEITVNRAATTPQELCGVDLKTQLKPALERLIHRYRRKAAELARDLQSCKEQLTAQGDRNADKAEETKNAQNDIAQLEGMLNAAKEQVEERVRRMTSQAGELRELADRLCGASSSRGEEVAQRQTRAQAEYEQTVKEATQEVAQLSQLMMTAMKMMYTHKEAVAAELRSAAVAVRDIYKEAARVSVPSV